MNFTTRRVELEGGPMLGMLSVATLLNGYSYFIPRLHIAKGVKPLVRWGKGRGKRSREGKLQGERTGGEEAKV